MLWTMHHGTLMEAAIVAQRSRALPTFVMRSPSKAMLRALILALKLLVQTGSPVVGAPKVTTVTGAGGA